VGLGRPRFKKVRDLGSLSCMARTERPRTYITETSRWLAAPDLTARSAVGSSMLLRITRDLSAARIGSKPKPSH
jgi:hypothetical protein